MPTFDANSFLEDVEEGNLGATVVQLPFRKKVDTVSRAKRAQVETTRERGSNDPPPPSQTSKYHPITGGISSEECGTEPLHLHTVVATFALIQ